MHRSPTLLKLPSLDHHTSLQNKKIPSYDSDRIKYSSSMASLPNQPLIEDLKPPPSRTKEADIVEDFKSDIDLLYFPHEYETYQGRQGESKFFNFNDLKKTEVYLKKKEQFMNKAPLASLSARLKFNSYQKHRLCSRLLTESEHSYHHLADQRDQWNKMKANRMKVIKRQLNGNFTEEDVQVHTERKKPEPLNLMAMFIGDEERSRQVKTYKLAWYPVKESGFKHIEALEGPTATVVNNTVFILGGFSTTSKKLFFSYELLTDKFTTLEPKGLLPSCIIYHTAVHINGQIYIFGGDSTSTGANSKMTTNEINTLNTDTLEWRKVKALKSVEPRKHHAACEFGHFMLVSGGLPDEGVLPFNDFQAFNTGSIRSQRIQRVVQDTRGRAVSRALAPHHGGGVCKQG